MFEILRLCDLSLILWVCWLMINFSYLLPNPMRHLLVEYSYLECFLMVLSLLDPFGLSLAPHKPSNSFTLFTLPMTYFTLQRFMVFGHSNGLIFIWILWYYSYYFNNHPPKYFQVHIFPFDWVLGTMTFQLPLDFHPIFSYPKPHGLMWDNRVSLLLCLKNLFFNFHLNLMWKSKFISSLSWVPNLGINGGEGKWPRTNPKVLIWFSSDSWVTLHLPTCIQTPYLYPFSITCVTFPLESEREAYVWGHNSFVWEK